MPTTTTNTSNLLQKLDIVIQNPGLMTNLLWKMQDVGNFQPVNTSISSFDFAKTGPFIERKLHELANEVDSLSTNLDKFKRHYFSKASDDNRRDNRRGRRGRDGEEEKEDVDRIGTLLSTQQISSFCTQINSFCKENNEKLLVAESFHKKNKTSSSSSTASSQEGKGN